MTGLPRAIESLFKDCLNIQKNEQVLLLCDKPQAELSQYFKDVLRSLSSETSYLFIPPIPHHGYELGKGFVSFMSQFDVVVMLTSHSLFHSSARLQATKRGVRILCLSHPTPESLIRNLDGLYKDMADRSRKIADIFTVGQQAQLTTPQGTHLTFSIARRKGFADTGLAIKPGQSANIPGGEGCVVPAPESAQGTVVIDGSFPEIGKLSEPIVLTIRNGVVTRITGAESAERLRNLLKHYGKQARILAEVGLGTNPTAKLTGDTLEDEKVLGTAHIGFGNNLCYEGRITLPCHLVGIMLHPTLVIDGNVIIEKGTFLV